MLVLCGNVYKLPRRLSNQFSETGSFRFGPSRQKGLAQSLFTIYLNDFDLFPKVMSVGNVIDKR